MCLYCEEKHLYDNINEIQMMNYIKYTFENILMLSLCSLLCDTKYIPTSYSSYKQPTRSIHRTEIGCLNLFQIQF